MSDTTLRARRDEWIDAGVFDALASRSPRRATTGSSGSTWTTSPSTGRCTRPLRRRGNRQEPRRPGEARLEVVRRRPTAPASRSAGRSTAPTATTPSARTHPRRRRRDRAARRHRHPAPRPRLRLPASSATGSTRRGLDRPRHPTTRHQAASRATPHRLTLGLRWIVEATNSWWSNYGQLRRNTDRRDRHRHAALCLATAVLIVGRAHRLPKPMEHRRPDAYPLSS